MSEATSASELQTMLDSIFSDVNTNLDFPTKRPLLAHYTSIEVLEQILKYDEVWFSNPLFMNDLEELRFGMTEGRTRLLANQEIKAAMKSEERYAELIRHFEGYLNTFDQDHAMDVFVLCLSEHDEGRPDGLLSMWRAYGANGNGAAIVFDTNKIEAKATSPLVIAPVIYASAQERSAWLDKKFLEFAELLARINLPDPEIFRAAWAIFQRIKYFALFSKHTGFSEEREWRIVYMKERDTTKELEPAFSYSVAKHGIEPKLKFSFVTKYQFVQPDLSLEKIVRQIILGPSSSAPLATRAVLRMLEILDRRELRARISVSSIPYRPR